MTSLVEGEEEAEAREKVAPVVVVTALPGKEVRVGREKVAPVVIALREKGVLVVPERGAAVAVLLGAISNRGNTRPELLIRVLNLMTRLSLLFK